MPAWLWYVIAVTLAAIAAVLLTWGLCADRPRGRRRCPKCWYDMAGIAGLRCPECGREHKTERRLHRARRRKLPVAAAAVFMLASAVAGLHPTMRDKPYGWWRLAPTSVLMEAAVRSDDLDRWDHVRARLTRGETVERPVYERDRAPGFAWRRYAAGCRQVILDPQRPPRVRMRAANELGAWNPDETSVTQEMSRAVAAIDLENAVTVAMAIARYRTEHGRLEDAWLETIATWAAMPEAANAASVLHVTLASPDPMYAATLKQALAQMPEDRAGRDLARQLVMAIPLRVSEVKDLAPALAFADDLRASTDPRVRRWSLEFQDLRAEIRARVAVHEAARIFYQEFPNQPAGVAGLSASDLRLRMLWLRNRLVANRPLTGPLRLLFGDLLRTLGRIRSEEAIRNGDMIDLADPEIDDQIAAMLTTRSCDAMREVARIVEHYLYLHGRLGEAWVDELLSAACTTTCPEAAALFAELLARDQVVRESELRLLLTVADASLEARYAVPNAIADGLALAGSPAIDRVLFIRALKPSLNEVDRERFGEIEEALAKQVAETR